MSRRYQASAATPPAPASRLRREMDAEVLPLAIRLLLLQPASPAAFVVEHLEYRPAHLASWTFFAQTF
jgi:hypothetical protein